MKINRTGVDRRGFVKGASFGALAFTLGGVEVMMAAGEARARGVPFRLLDGYQGETLEALGETLVPQAKEAGIAHFIDQQLSVPAHESLLQARIFNFRPPFADFYRAAITAVDGASRRMFGRDFAPLQVTEQRDFVGQMRQNKIEGWNGPTGATVYPIMLEGKNPMAYAAQGGWGVGGAALHYYANFPRLLPTDFRIKSEHNRAHDWPISYPDGAPFYDKVARDTGVSGDARAEEQWRPAGEAYPMPPMKTFRNGDIWLKGFEAAGIPMVKAPVGMNSVEYKGRPACLYDGWCHVGCPIGALANPQITYLGDARRAGAEVRALCTVTRVLTNPAGTRATGVEYYDDKKQKQVQEASVVLLAAWSAQNPRLLLNSATDQHKNGLGNASGLVGRFMMSHHVASTWAMFDEDVQNHLGTIAVQYMSYATYPKTSHQGAFGSSFITAGFALKTTDLANSRGDLFGAELADYMKRAARHLAGIKTFGEEQPNPENRVELISAKDEFGMPLGKLTHTYDQDAVALWNANLEEGLKVAKAAGAKEAWSARGSMPTSHLMGGTIMGTNAANSVVDSYGQSHEIPNLWIAGPSIFPTSGASNPTFTIFALSQRGAERMTSQWGTLTN